MPAGICDIYNHYVRATIITFEESPVPAAEMASRIEGVVPHLPWLVWEEGSEILGYTYATPWKARAAYRHSVEGSVYLDPRATGRGLGTKLYATLIEDAGAHAVVQGDSIPASRTR